MEVLSTKTGIRSSSTTRTVSEHLFKEIGETTCITSGKFLSVGRVPICAATICSKTCATLTAETCTAKASETSCPGLLPCPLLGFKLISMLPVLTIFIIFLSFFRIT